MTARNDDYGGNQLHRIQAAVDSILTYADRHGVDLEVIIVEWNPPADEPPLEAAIDWPEHSTHVTVRILTVPHSIHEQRPNSDELPLFEYVAKNVGIRRSRGEFVLSTNPDNVFSEALFEYIGQQGLDPDVYYRINRYNLDSLVDLDDTPEEWEASATANLQSIFTAAGPYWPGQYWRRVRHFLYIYRHYPWAALDSLRYWFGAEPRSLYGLHHTAGGDFIMMHRDGWERIRGHPEFDYNTHVDSYTMLQAATVLEERCLPDEVRLYHQPHDDQHDLRPKGDWETLLERSREMLISGDPLFFNEPDAWGLPERAIPETVVLAAGS
jgi:hypothetical protein